MAIEIEKGVPVPVRGDRMKYPFAQMDVGDSFVIPIDGARSQQIAGYGNRWAERTGRNGVRFSSRLSEDRKTVRVWRVA